MLERLARLRRPPSLRGTAEVHQLGPRRSNISSACRLGADAAGPRLHSQIARFWIDESVGQTLVIALSVIMGDQIALAIQNSVDGIG